MSPERIPVDPTEEFYAKALGKLVGPTARMAATMRALNIAYWVAVFLVIAWIGSQVIDRAPAVTVSQSEVLTPIVDPGGQLRVAYVIERERTCQTDTYWTIYDGSNELRRFGPSTTIAAGPPGTDVYTRSWTIPANAAPGPSKLRVTLTWQCPGNYLHTIYPVTLSLPDVFFEIAPPRKAS